jgi:hypothetical protein
MLGENRGCFNELYRRYNEDIELPIAKPSDAVVPAGCITPTFTGAGIDCDQVGLFAARYAASLLCDGQAEAYPPFDWDVGVFNFRDKSGAQAIVPQWKTYNLYCPSDCKYCGGGDG